MKKIYIQSGLLFSVIFLSILNFSCKKPVSCSLPTDSEVAAMKSKWLVYHVGDTLTLLSNRGDTNTYYFIREDAQYVNRNDNEANVGINCYYVYFITFKTNLNYYGSVSYVLFPYGEISLQFNWILNSGNKQYNISMEFFDCDYQKSMIINNDTFYDIYHYYSVEDTSIYDVYYSRTAGFVKFSVNNDSLYFLPEEYW